MKFSVLASGSSGNACYIEKGNTRVIIDAGLSSREIERRLGYIGVDPKSLDALIITHEHSDHIKGVGPFSRRFKLPVYINHKTLRIAQKTLGGLPEPVIVKTGDTITIKELCIETFTKCHDAADPVGLVLSHFNGTSSNGKKLGIITDLGRSTGLVEDRLNGCHALIMEFNYDQEMLDQGPYPLFIKRRINGQDGHLSNKQAACLLETLSHENLEHVVLAHLSEINNQPEKAYREAANALDRCGFGGINIVISRQDMPGPIISLE
ncbi:MAG TPA: MBL fold metallo-hydrolase [Desulfobacteraceae bacterium]|nr:MBL fold metallo-hydrolase [Desulfobacteraceae bacterium]HPJ66419.1 MBL fold metallo-hydrolase [Desulfobacteraceae bacterium]HPQ27341.1 MBL fold metallo-hydrolase [Desulfobacteraceae bacterium]